MVFQISVALYLVELRWPSAYFLFFSVFLLLYKYSKFVNKTINLSLILQKTRIQKQFPLSVFVFIDSLVVSASQDAGGYAISCQNNLELHLGCHTCLMSYFALVCLWCGRTVGQSVGVRSRDNQIFSDGQFTTFSYPWCSTARASRARAPPLDDFLCYSKGGNVKRTETINDYNKAGLKMLDIQSFNASLKMKRVQSYLMTENKGKWKAFVDYYLESYGGKLLFLCNLKQKDASQLKIKDPF